MAEAKVNFGFRFPGFFFNEHDSNPVALKSTVQRAAAQSQRICRLAHSVAMARERFSDQERLYLPEAHLLQTTPRLTPLHATQLPCAHSVFTSHQYCARHAV